jgi:acetyl-CoA carboxylase carboxyl transferase subunit alpha
MPEFLEFEKEIKDIEEQIALIIKAGGKNLKEGKKEISALEEKLKRKITEIYNNLTPWQIVQIARHPERPKTYDYIELIMEDFVELKGDRLFGDDPAIVGGIAKFRGKTIIVCGTQKGKNTEENLQRRFGMPNPEGYRKAQRLMKLAEKMKVPFITFIDTPGAYPGIESEERGQAEAIGKNLEILSILRVPTLSVVIGEGGSGGALALGLTDVILMLEYSIYSVISPEGCAAILRKDENMKDKCANLLKITSLDLYNMKIIDEIVK